MKRVFLIGLTHLALAHSASAAAQPTWYVHGDIGRLSPVSTSRYFASQDSTAGNVMYTNDTGHAFQFGTGLSFYDTFRMEINLLRSLDSDINAHGSALIRAQSSNKALITQLHLDFGSFLQRFTTKVEPYVFAGAGLNKTHLSGVQVKNSSTTQEMGHYSDHKTRTLATRYGAGVAYHFNPTWTLDLQYHYSNLGKAFFGPFVGGTANASSTPYVNLRYQGAQINVRYYFTI
jgi:opacity protein-like surface antigen